MGHSAGHRGLAEGPGRRVWPRQTIARAGAPAAMQGYRMGARGLTGCGWAVLTGWAMASDAAMDDMKKKREKKNFEPFFV